MAWPRASPPSSHQAARTRYRHRALLWRRATHKPAWAPSPLSVPPSVRVLVVTLIVWPAAGALPAQQSGVRVCRVLFVVLMFGFFSAQYGGTKGLCTDTWTNGAEPYSVAETCSTGTAFTSGSGSYTLTRNLVLSKATGYTTAQTNCVAVTVTGTSGTDRL